MFKAKGSDAVRPSDIFMQKVLRLLFDVLKTDILEVAGKDDFE